MRDLNLDELDQVYGAGGKSRCCYCACDGGSKSKKSKSKKSKSKKSKSKKSKSKSNKRGSKGYC